MANFDTSKKGMKIYAKCLDESRMKGEVGPQHHMKQPQPMESRLGFVGKPASKSTMKLLAEKGLVKAAVETPKASGGKAKSKPALTEQQMKAEIERLKAILAEANKTPEQVSKEQALAAKWEAEKIEKVRAKMDVLQYGRNVKLLPTHKIK